MKRTSRAEINPPSPGTHFTKLIEARDFLRVHLPKLTEKQRATVVAWAGGMTCREIAAAEDVTEEAIHARLSAGLDRLRRLGGAA